MVGEASPQVREQPATSKKRMQLWLFVAVGFIGLLLFVLAVYQVMTRAHNRTAAAAQAAPASAASTAAPTPKRGSEFDDLVASRRPSAPTNTDADEGTSTVAQGPKVTSVDDLLKPTNGTPKGAQDSGQSGSAASTKAGQQLADFEMQERLRALRSGQTWKTASGGASAAPQADAMTSPSSSAPSTAPPAPLTSSSDLAAKRADVARQIQQAEALRAKLMSGQLGADPSSADVMKAQTQLDQVSQQFKAPPVNVAGYTQENAYGADTAGLSVLPPGTQIQAQFMQKVMSDFDGTLVKGQVTFPVYDLQREHVLVPQGSVVLLRSHKASGVNEAIQNRMGFSVVGLVRPDGKLIDMSKASAVDREGVGAIKDQVDRHLLAQFTGVVAYALVSSDTSREGTSQFDRTSYSGEIGSALRQNTAQLVQKYLNLSPTVTIRAGQTFNIILEAPVYVQPWSDIYASYR